MALDPQTPTTFESADKGNLMVTKSVEHDFRSRLATGQPMLLDGGIGTELQHRGVNVRLGAFGATAVGEAPEVVSQIHADYLRVGADIITTSSYTTTRGRLAALGLGDKMEAYSRLAVELAVQARDRLAPDAFVAAATTLPLTTPLGNYSSPPPGFDLALAEPPETLFKEWSDQMAVLANAGADLILLETINTIPQAKEAVRAANETGLPVLLGVYLTPEGTLLSGASLKDVIAALDSEGVHIDGFNLMCTPPETISKYLPRLREVFDGPIGAYANNGYGSYRAPTQVTPDRYAEYGQEWLDMGCQIVGGCCATTPEHIAALRSIVKPTSPQVAA